MYSLSNTKLKHKVLGSNSPDTKQNKHCTIIFMTSENFNMGGNPLDYDDAVMLIPTPCGNGDEINVFFSGSDFAKYDHNLIEAVKDEDDFHIFWRRRTNDSFSYVAKTKKSFILRNREVPAKKKATKREKLLICLKCNNTNEIEFKHFFTIPGKFKGIGRYKFDVFHYLGIIDDVGGDITNHNHNINLGFYRVEI